MARRWNGSAVTLAVGLSFALMGGGCGDAPSEYDRGHIMSADPTRSCSADEDCPRPRGCHLSVCNVSTGRCELTPKAAGSACSDGDPCTDGDACDGSGVCVQGVPKVCAAPTTICQSGPGVCDPQTGACRYAPAMDGTACGMTPAERCCGGACVDTSTDREHCGGCNTACRDGAACEPIPVTSTCSLETGGAVGQCGCAANAGCPREQICRTTGLYANRCAPINATQCAPGQHVAGGSDCPTHCTW